METLLFPLLVPVALLELSGGVGNVDVGQLEVGQQGVHLRLSHFAAGDVGVAALVGFLKTVEPGGSQKCHDDFARIVVGGCDLETENVVCLHVDC